MKPNWFSASKQPDPSRSLNCQQGDLAHVVKSIAGNEGMVVRCVRFVGRYQFSNGDIGEDVWEVEPDAIGHDGLPTAFIEDAWLRPLRGGTGEDETIAWAGKPQKAEK